MTEIKIPIPILMDIVELKKHELNVKEHPESQINNLMNLIKMVGFKDPIVIDRDNIIWAGHGRLEAAFRLAMAQVPIIYLEDLSESQKKLFMYMDNQINESPWVMENVKILLGDVPQIELEQFQVDFNDILDITIEEEQEIPEVPVEPKSKIGEVYQLGNHRVMCGDSLKDLSKFLQEKKPRVLYTDPPYGLGGYAGRSGKFEAIIGDDKDARTYYESLPKDIPERYIWGNWFNIKSINEEPRDVIVWKKNNFGMGKGYRGQYEICLYFGSFAGSDSDLWEVKKDFVSEYKHPTQKPTELARRAIFNSSKEKDLILDCYLGSGSTLIACEQTNRTCYGMEIDPGYVDVIIQRWENFTGKKAELVNTYD